MRIVEVKLKSSTPYSQGRPIQSEKPARETHDDFEVRTWRERMHVTEDGLVKIPPGSLKNCLAEAAKFKSMKIPGQRNSTYTKHFEAGVMVVDPLVTAVKAADVPGERLFVPADGVRGSGKRVWKNFPLINAWQGTARFYIIDELITEPVFLEHLKDAGSLVGIGRFRPRNNGYYGRFDIVSHNWGEEVV